MNTYAAKAPTRAVALYGTDEPVPAMRVLSAGGLTAEFDAGNLRHIRFQGIELIRAISFIVRDRNWGTYNPDISDLRVTETGDGFTVAYEAVAGDDSQTFRYRAEISGASDGQLSFRARGVAQTDFLTNRTGFVVLHPIKGVAGEACTVEHVDGTTRQARFPDLIDPVQPMRDLRAITHAAADGLLVTCRMEGDSYEMEDQRNWADASYKTYVRPLALPWPYLVDAGTELEQSVTLSLSGAPAAHSAAGADRSLRLGEREAAAPPVGLGFDPDEADATLAAAKTLKAAGANHLICHYDPRRGHDRTTLSRAVDAAAAIGARPWLEAVIASVEEFQAEIAELGAQVAALGSPFEVVLVSPAPDLKCTLPGSVWPPAPPPEELFRAARAAFPRARLGGGMFSLFTELNRKRPPAELLDLISFTTIAVMHAGDDLSVMEGLEALPAIAASAKAIAGGKPFAVGPSAIGMRMNPYGDAPVANPGNIRQAMNFNDPRQRGLLGAAWTLGAYAQFAMGGASAIAFGGTTGAFGLVHAPHSWPQPWYEQNGGFLPVFHVVRGLARLSGGTLREVEFGEGISALGVGCERDGGLELWLANTGSDRLTVQLPTDRAQAALLDETNFSAASHDTEWMDRLSPTGDLLTLDAFAVARVMLPQHI